MSIRYLPDEFLKKAVPVRKLENAVSSKLTLKRSALTNAKAFDFLDAKEIESVALNTIKGYKTRVREGLAEKAELAYDPKQLVQRVQNEVVFQVSNAIKEKYPKEFYIWLPSDANEPDPEHQLNYGKKFQVGEGEMPGDRYGCRCGMEILVDDSSLDL